MLNAHSAHTTVCRTHSSDVVRAIKSLLRLHLKIMFEYGAFGDKHEKITQNTSRAVCTATRGSVAEWLARRTRDLEVAGSIPDNAMLQLPWESNLP
ncbi:hypothetical protein ElyMa_004964300 [Elysia marginata]|uniref:Uncharacterized protein n=1 Tax=Elysia marginata TaxID=1093978 RepID=A0AAV4J732_9GAST|nr:hypothetical protein ElyMa_004964300 [Elysia marginata]